MLFFVFPLVLLSTITHPENEGSMLLVKAVSRAAARHSSCRCADSAILLCRCSEFIAIQMELPCLSGRACLRLLLTFVAQQSNGSIVMSASRWLRRVFSLRVSLVGRNSGGGVFAVFTYRD